MEIKLAGYNVDNDSIKDLQKIVSYMINEIKAIQTAEGDKGIIDRQSSFLTMDYNRMTKILSNMTPETICASYARISRDPRSIPELRANARNDVERARKTNSNIIFNVGHKSIAEHAQFNFDIMGLSRICVETLEKKRLCGYTEKSQRYIICDNIQTARVEIESYGVGKFTVKAVQEDISIVVITMKEKS